MLDAIRILEFTPCEYRNQSGTLQGFLTIQVGVFILRGIAVHSSGNRNWILTPARANGVRPDGKRVFEAYIDFVDLGDRGRFEQAVLKALEEAYPER
jgi:hypothetical protein